jgi:hypothetical protein
MFATMCLLVINTKNFLWFRLPFIWKVAFDNIEANITDAEKFNATRMTVKRVLTARARGPAVCAAAAVIEKVHLSLPSFNQRAELVASGEIASNGFLLTGGN